MGCRAKVEHGSQFPPNSSSSSNPKAKNPIDESGANGRHDDGDGEAAEKLPDGKFSPEELESTGNDEDPGADENRRNPADDAGPKERLDLRPPVLGCVLV